MLKVVENKEATYLLNLVTNPLKSFEVYLELAEKVSHSMYEFSELFEELEILSDVVMQQFRNEARVWILFLKIVEQNGRRVKEK